MFRQMKNIDSAFRYIRAFSLTVILGCIALCCLVIWKSYRLVSGSQARVYVLAGGQAFQAIESGRQENIPVEARDHIRMFHEDFFTLDPDDKVIRANIAKALYLADGSAKREYDDLKESGYYANIIAGNISQRLTVDSIHLDIGQYPYYFKCYATERIIRTSNIVIRSLITQGYLRNVLRSDNNPHGFLIEKWEILENRDLRMENQ